ncbi:hypothetical protein ACFSYG_11835 [Leeuwenhoekiella polynyae]|uniref:Uncharacterized protein n=1 Tax=Leeuwenhoekiella polynyae TaxID=1550906 RepID=A0A4Q0PFP7_9FLAO|nr:hypothetical protein [Leeuwenhoekiella polynyae]RXG25714.1 hypothetical protein DSM02_881 [Leeuwenhoekiella polynyae]
MVADNLNKNLQSNIETWFDALVANLRFDQTLLEHEILQEEKKEVYTAMISGDHDFMHNYARNGSSTYFIRNMVDAYISDIIKAKSKPKKLALELSNSKILVWAEITEDDEIMEDALILAEAKINAHFSDYGFHVSSTIVEDVDGLQIPEHYRSIEIA